MNSISLVQIGLMTITLVFGGRILGVLLHQLIEKYFNQKSHFKDHQSLDDFLLSKNFEMKYRQMRSQYSVEAKKEEPPPSEPLLIENELSPQEKKQKQMMARIYHFNPKRLTGEDDTQYNARILELENSKDIKSVKKSFNKKAKEYHPDSFDLSGFDPKLRQKLSDKIHKNYIVIQKAYEYFKKSA
jgi:hypothetical protein